MAGISWLDHPEHHDFDAAAAYLGLLADDATVTATVDRMRGATTTTHQAKDILRAARLPLLDHDNPHVKSDLAKVSAGHPLSPILLVRGDGRTGVALQIADGYHRVCASYHLDENTDIPAVLVPWAPGQDSIA